MTALPGMSTTKDSGTTRRTFLKAGGAAAVGGLAGTMISCSGEEGPEKGPLLAQPPALFRPTEEGCTVHWEPNGRLETRLLYRPPSGAPILVHEGVSPETTTVHVTGLPPHALAELALEYRGSADEAWRQRRLGPVRTGRAPGQPYRMALLADSHIYNGGKFTSNFQRTLEVVAADRPDFVIFAGDEAGVFVVGDEEGATPELVERRWRRWRQVSDALLAGTPSFMVLGNHEGEAGYYRSYERAGAVEALQDWGTAARLRHYVNPDGGTYPEGGEPRLQNYFAFTWGDALFVVIDVHRYTGADGQTPERVEDWTLGAEQREWLERTLLGSGARWKFVVGHHLLGGWNYDLAGRRQDTRYKYGRGGARYATVGEQGWLDQLMERAGAQVFFYGHDHVFSHQRETAVHYVCCGRTSAHSRGDNRWWRNKGWKEAYGDYEARDPHDFYAAIGYTRLEVSPENVALQYVRSLEEPDDNVTTPVRGVVHEVLLS